MFCLSEFTEGEWQSEDEGEGEGSIVHFYSSLVSCIRYLTDPV